MFLSKILDQLPLQLRNQFFSFAKAANSNFSHRRLRVKFLESLRKDIETLKLGHSSSQWSDYYRTVDANYFATDISPGEWHRKKEVVNRLISKTAPKSVLDVGTNTGQWTLMFWAAGLSGGILLVSIVFRISNVSKVNNLACNAAFIAATALHFVLWLHSGRCVIQKSKYSLVSY